MRSSPNAAQASAPAIVATLIAVRANHSERPSR